MRFRRKRRTKLCTKMLRGLGPLMGLLALSAPIFAEPLASWSRAANATERRMAKGLATGQAPDSPRFFHPLVALLGLAAAGSSSFTHHEAHHRTILGWEALRETSLGGSIWMVRDRWMGGHRLAVHNSSLVSLLRC